MTETEEIEQLKKENEELKQQNALKSNWISISAHQLRTTLSAVKWILRMFLDKDFGELTPEQTDFMKRASDSNERMLALVNEMLSLNHADTTSLTYNFEEVDMVKLIDETLFDFSSEAFKKGIETIFLKPENTIKQITCDKEKVRVVIQNLIENAIKYSNTGDKVLISIHANENEVEISVKDTGIGIPLSEQEQIFGKFYRATNAKAKDSIGSGLGLYTTKHIIEKHGGKIDFKSTESEGTTFTFSLPLHR